MVTAHGMLEASRSNRHSGYVKCDLKSPLRTSKASTISIYIHKLNLYIVILITEAHQHQEGEDCEEDLEATSLRVPFLCFYHVDLLHVPRPNIRVKFVNWRNHWIGLRVSKVNEHFESLLNYGFEYWVRVGQSLLSAYAWW